MPAALIASDHRRTDIRFIFAHAGGTMPFIRLAMVPKLEDCRAATELWPT